MLLGIHPSWVDGESGDEDSPHRIDSVVTWSGAAIFQGDIDPEAIADAAEIFERVDERDGFVVYEGTEADSSVGPETAAFAVDESRLVLNTGTEDGRPAAAIENPIDVAAGDTERLSGDSDADWAIRTAGHGLCTTGLWGEEAFQGGAGSEQPGGPGSVSPTTLNATDGLVSSLVVGDEQVRSTLATVYPEGETPERDAIESALGPSASDLDVGIDGARVDVTATYPVESRGTGTGDSSESMDGEETDTPTPEPEYEVLIEERVNDGAEYTLNLDVGSTLRLTVDHDGEGQTLVYMRNDDGDVFLNEATDSSDTWEVEIPGDNEFFVEAYLSPADADGSAMVTIEVKEV